MHPTWHGVPMYVMWTETIRNLFEKTCALIQNHCLNTQFDKTQEFSMDFPWANACPGEVGVIVRDGYEAQLVKHLEWCVTKSFCGLVDSCHTTSYGRTAHDGMSFGMLACDARLGCDTLPRVAECNRGVVTMTCHDPVAMKFAWVILGVFVGAFMALMNSWSRSPGRFLQTMNKL